MTVRICNANTPELLDAVYQVRHKVFSEEEGKFAASPDGRVIDRFDAYGTSQCIAVLSGQEVVGTLRLTEDSALGLPADEYFDFREHVPEGSHLLSCGMFCVRRDFRSPRLSLGLMLMASYLALSKGITHVAAPINPMIARLLKRTGFRQIGDEFTDAHLGLPVLPMLLDMSELNDHFVHFIRKNDLYNFIRSYECYMFESGEQIIKAGEPGDMAYIILEGEAEVRSKESGALLSTLEGGDIFGEMALFTEDTRSADVFAKTELKAMALHKNAFMRHLQEDPESALKKLVNTLAQRIKLLNEKIV